MFKTQSQAKGVEIMEISERCLMASAQLGAVVSCGREGRMAGALADLQVSDLGGEEGVPGGGSAWGVRGRASLWPAESQVPVGWTSGERGLVLAVRARV